MKVNVSQESLFKTIATKTQTNCENRSLQGPEVTLENPSSKDVETNSLDVTLTRDNTPNGSLNLPRKDSGGGIPLLKGPIGY